MAKDYHAESDISCYNAGVCDGFGTCKACTKFDQGGLKTSYITGDSADNQIPMTLQMYNARARHSKCCNWKGPPAEYKTVERESDFNLPVSSITSLVTGDDVTLTVGTLVPTDFPRKLGGGVLKREGVDTLGKFYKKIKFSYTSVNEGIFTEVKLLNLDNISDPVEETTYLNKVQDEINSGYGVYLSKVRHLPIFKATGVTPNTSNYEKETKCSVTKAAPWQQAWTEENSYYLGCNGAKPECPYYTGPTFEHVVDSKLDFGDRVTASQVMELRYYSKDWKSMPDPNQVWDETFYNPIIWSWAEDASTGNIWDGRLDVVSNKPLIRKVQIGDLRKNSPDILIGGPVIPTDGTPIDGGPPDYPTLVRELTSFAFSGTSVFPKDTTENKPFVKKIFKHEDRYFYVAAKVNTDTQVLAINMTKHPNSSYTDGEFIDNIIRNFPEDVYYPFTSALPESTFNVELITLGGKEKVNNIRVFSYTGDLKSTLGRDKDNFVPDVPTAERHYSKIDFYVKVKMYHSLVAQTYFNDEYGHRMVDAWVNNFTRFNLGGNILNICNAESSEVLWNSISSEGRKSIYLIEDTVEATSEDKTKVEWISLDCNFVQVTIKDLNVSRIAPWKCWGSTSLGDELYVELDRSNNNKVTEQGNVKLELALASTKGTILPSNVVIFRIPEGTALTVPLDEEFDILKVKYSYSTYKQGPIKESDKVKLKYPSDLDNKVIDMMPYSIDKVDNSFEVEGTFVKVGDLKIHSCDEIIGDCFSSESLENERLSRAVFFRGGIEEDSIQTNGQIVSKCQQEFNIKIAGKKFEDGTDANYIEVSNRVKSLPLKEGSMHLLFTFKDEEGRYIGVKNEAMLLQSSVAQARDVEIKYNWGTQVHHYPNHNPMFLLARFYEPLFATNDRLATTQTRYEPRCGDHKESHIGLSFYTAFDSSIDKIGALWYPYNKCEVPEYHVHNKQNHLSPVEYTHTVEGFTQGKRGPYWERMRAFDRYTPFIMWFVTHLGCYWSEVTSTAESYAPFEFLGYTKIRSHHIHGNWAVDREALRLSRHWEKRNLSVQDETLTLEDGEHSISLTEEYTEAMFDDEGNLKYGSDVQTPVWVHINDGYSVVAPMSESVKNPLGRYLMYRSGSHNFSEIYVQEVKTLSDVFEEKDYTTTTSRTTDGSVPYTPDVPTFNVVGGLALSQEYGKEIRHVFKNTDAGDTSWCWISDANKIVRPVKLLNFLNIKNPEIVYFDTNFYPSTFVEEGTHTLTYNPHEFDLDGNVSKAGYITLDGGPKLYIKLYNGTLDYLVEGELSYLLDENLNVVHTGGTVQDEISPYDYNLHKDTDYEFTLFTDPKPGNNYLLLADDYGLRRLDVNDKVIGTYSGVLVGQKINVNELPYSLLTVSKNSGFGLGQQEIFDACKEYLSTSNFIIPTLDLKGNYFVEKIKIDSIYGEEFHVPTIKVYATLYPSNKEVLVFTSDYFYDDGAARGTSYNAEFSVNARVSKIDIFVGARGEGKVFVLNDIVVNYRNNIYIEETIVCSHPKVNVSTGLTGTHKPSDLEFYFNRAYPDFSKSLTKGYISTFGNDNVGSLNAPIPAVSIKYNTRKVRDLVPYFEFSDPAGSRFIYDNLKVEDVPGYAFDSTAFGGGHAYVSGAVKTSSKGWTLHTTDYKEDPGGDVNHEFTFNGQVPLEGLQLELYDKASNLLDDSVTEYGNFWHPDEIEIFNLYGVDLTNISWVLKLYSTVTRLDKVFRHEEYGCYSNATSVEGDGRVHVIENWQPRGVFHYQCDPKFNEGCYAIVMNKCNYFFSKDYGTTKYLNNDVIQRFSHSFTIPVDDYAGYISAGKVDYNYTSGVIGGIVPTSAAATSVGLHGRASFSKYTIDPSKPGKFQ